MHPRTLGLLAAALCSYHKPEQWHYQTCGNTLNKKMESPPAISALPTQGTGTGLVGIALALAGAQVVLTDMVRVMAACLLITDTVPLGSDF